VSDIYYFEKMCNKNSQWRYYVVGAQRALRTAPELEIGLGLVIGLNIEINCIFGYGGPWLWRTGTWPNSN